MSNPPSISTPWSLRLKRMQFQLVPMLSVLVCAALAAWIWTGQNTSTVTTGEVEAIRVQIQAKFDGVLEELPKPIRLFDSVESGQVVARLDTGLMEAEVHRLEQEITQGPTTNASVPWHQARIDELRQRIAKRDIKAPFSGIITAILKRPGENVIVADPILRIAAERGNFVVGYLREGHMVRPSVGMSVQIESRMRPGRSYKSEIKHVGAQVEALPARYWTNPQIPEWGLPIQIVLPSDARLTPGELVDLTLKPAKVKEK